MLKTIVKVQILKAKLQGEVKAFIKNEKGLTTAEWIILASFLVLIAVGLGIAITPIIKGMIGKVSNQLNTANNQTF